MAKSAVVQTGGKQYLVSSNQEITVQKLVGDAKTIDLQVLAVFDDESSKLELGTPFLKNVLTATVVENGKGEKIRVARFKSKTRYRKVTGFRPQLTKIKIGEI